MESMLEYAATGATMPTETEAYETLLARAHRKTGTVAPERAGFQGSGDSASVSAAVAGSAAACRLRAGSSGST